MSSVPAAFDPLDFMPRAGAARSAGGQPRGDAEEQAPTSGSERVDGSGKEDVGELKKRVAELEKLVSSLASKKSARKKAASKK
jgi:hypothetical protein